jgi:hypothetical protein
VVAGEVFVGRRDELERFAALLRGLATGKVAAGAAGWPAGRRGAVARLLAGRGWCWCTGWAGAARASCWRSSG